jgi:hypothetical protein
MARELEFVALFEEIAQEALGSKAIVRRKMNLFYELFLDQKLELAIVKPGEELVPKRGMSAYQTDICICEKVNGIDLPRVAIEFKGDITTHDVLTYSNKAGKHKQIYPWLRYGLIASKLESIPGRFFAHNENLDFFIAAKRHSVGPALSSLARTLIEKELKVSRILEEIHFADRQVDYYCRDIIFKNFAHESGVG